VAWVRWDFGDRLDPAAILEWHKRIDLTPAEPASAATLNNIGPVPARIGATQKGAWLADASKANMSVSMAAGRLESFTIRVSLTPRLGWRFRRVR